MDHNQYETHHPYFNIVKVIEKYNGAGLNFG